MTLIYLVNSETKDLLNDIIFKVLGTSNLLLDLLLKIFYTI
jgi:hypothetical protein